MKRLLIVLFLVVCSCSREPENSLKRLDRRLDAEIDRAYERDCDWSDLARDASVLRARADQFDERLAALLDRVERIERSR